MCREGKSKSLYFLGEKLFPRLPGIAVIGTRNPGYGINAAFEFASLSANLGYMVVSGLALGCDTAAHIGCLESGGTTMAVFPCGLNHVAPASNRPLARRIVNSGGRLVSEYSPETPPRNFRFVERNRVIASLSQAVIIIEAEVHSGTMHTARFALEQNKPLACYVPKAGRLSPGCRHLIENNDATPLRNLDDLKLFLELLSRDQQSLPGTVAAAPPAAEIAWRRASARE